MNFYFIYVWHLFAPIIFLKIKYSASDSSACTHRKGALDTPSSAFSPALHYLFWDILARTIHTISNETAPLIYAKALQYCLFSFQSFPQQSLAQFLFFTTLSHIKSTFPSSHPVQSQDLFPSQPPPIQTPSAYTRIFVSNAHNLAVSYTGLLTTNSPSTLVSHLYNRRHCYYIGLFWSQTW